MRHNMTGVWACSMLLSIAMSVRAGDSPILPELAGLKERWQSAMTDLDVPGLAVVVVKDDKVIYTETLGVRDPLKNTPVSPETMFYIASCTKSYVAMAMMTLVDEGKVALDDPVKKYLPRFQTAEPTITESLTIRDLLSHAKGLNSGPIVTLDAYTGGITEDRFYRWLKEAKAKGSFDYTNLHYTLAGRVIEAVSGKSWKDFLDERLFRPSGMTRTTAYASRMYSDANCALPSELADGKLVPTRIRKTDRVMHAAGGLGSTIEDLGRWLRLNLNLGSIDGKRIISENSAREMQKVQAKLTPPQSRGSRTREGYGLGWNVGPYEKVTLLEHGGGYVGTSALVAFAPEKKFGVAVVANAATPIGEIAIFDVCDRMLGVQSEDTLPKLKQAAADRRRRVAAREKSTAASPVSAAALSLPIKSYTGPYDNEDWGGFDVELDGDRLAARWGDLRMVFRSVTNDTFLADSGSGDPDQGRFEIRDGKVEAVVIVVDAETKLEARFKRKTVD